MKSRDRKGRAGLRKRPEEFSRGAYATPLALRSKFLGALTQPRSPLTVAALLPPAPIPSAWPAGDQRDQSDEQSGTDDGPDDRERLIADHQLEILREIHGPRDPHAKQGADESQCDRGQASAARIADNRLPHCPANPGHHQQNHKIENRHGSTLIWTKLLSTLGSAIAVPKTAKKRCTCTATSDRPAGGTIRAARLHF